MSSQGDHFFLPTRDAGFMRMQICMVPSLLYGSSFYFFYGFSADPGIHNGHQIRHAIREHPRPHQLPARLKWMDFRCIRKNSEGAIRHAGGHPGDVNFSGPGPWYFASGATTEGGSLANPFRSAVPFSACASLHFRRRGRKSGRCRDRRH